MRTKKNQMPGFCLYSVVMVVVAMFILNVLLLFCGEQMMQMQYIACVSALDMDYTNARIHSLHHFFGN